MSASRTQKYFDPHIYVEYGEFLLKLDRLTESQSALKVDFIRLGTASIEFLFETSPWDWSAFGAIAVDVSNPADQEVRVGIELYDVPTRDLAKYVGGSGNVAPHDTVIFNIYRSHVDPRDWGFAPSLNKPCIIGEFHFGAVDRGMFHSGLVTTPNQQARAAMYKQYLESVEDNPSFVGCHWFQYCDEPLTGRSFDGENYNIGLVSVADTHYPEMVEAAQAVASELYSRRGGPR